MSGNGFPSGRLVTAICVAFVLLLPAADLARAKMLNVVVTIKPLHSLVAGMMLGIGEPELVIRGTPSPHLYVLKPSDIKMFADADLLVWVGASMETFLHRHLARSRYDIQLVSPLEMRGVTLLSKRRGTKWEPDYDEIDGDGSIASDVHAWVDAHVWLDPHNARGFIDGLEGELARIDPEHGQVYARNGRRLRARLADLETEIRDILESHSNDVYLVFHDAYQYFERRFDLHPVGSITIHPENPPSARRIMEVRALVVDRSAACVFSEPQFKSGIIDRLIQETGTRPGLLDPIGADLVPGPDLYFKLLRNLARSLAECL